MVEIVRHCQAKATETDRLDLNYSRHCSTRLPIGSQGEQNLGRGKGQCFHQDSEGGKDRRLQGGWKLR